MEIVRTRITLRQDSALADPRRPGDGTGRLLQSIQLQSNQGTHLLDTRKLPAGIYSCVIKAAGMQKTVKLVFH